MPDCPALLTSIARDQTAPFAVRAPAFRATIRNALPARLAALAGQGHRTGAAAGRKHRD